MLAAVVWALDGRRQNAVLDSFRARDESSVDPTHRVYTHTMTPFPRACSSSSSLPRTANQQRGFKRRDVVDPLFMEIVQDVF